MRSISKGTEPPELTEAKREAKRLARLHKRKIRKEDYELANKDMVRKALHKEQGGICAYCCCRIDTADADRKHPEMGGMSIEHWIPRSGYPDSTEKEKERCGEQCLDWSNLLGVCVGIAVFPDKKDEYHCDQSRGNAHLSIHPAKDSNIESRFKFKKNGEIEPADRKDTATEKDIERLNLNNDQLVLNRKAAIKFVQQELMKNDSPQNIKRLWKSITKPEADGFRPYAPAARHYLLKKIKAKNISID